jgi:molybdate transport system ATP-binding protein
MNMSEEPIIHLNHITIRVRDRFILPDTDWEIRKNQNWAILGPNGSGKSSLARALTGEVPVVRGAVRRHLSLMDHNSIGYVSLGLHQRIIAHEEEMDEARFFSGKLDTFVTAMDTLLSGTPIRDPGHPHFRRIVEILDFAYLLDRPVRVLSTGEIRKILIARALLKDPKLLILDEPFEGLDIYYREHLRRIVMDLMARGMQIILVTHRFEEVLPGITHVLCLKNCRVFLQGTREEVLLPEHMDGLYDRKGPAGVSCPDTLDQWDPMTQTIPPVLLNLKNTTVRYGDLVVLDRLNWTMRRGENWAIVGPNGSGKTTLLKLILGDHLQAYANEIYLFGKRKGTGESIWDIKQRIGVVSSELQVSYRKRMRAYDVVASGLFDSIGLYRRLTPQQEATVRRWIELLGMEDKADRMFDQLSYGERRMVLLGRSMVKSPTLLILDEPCQGLDKSNRSMILDLIEYIGRGTHTHLLYVTHIEDEIPSCITHVLKLEKQRDTSVSSCLLQGRSATEGTAPVPKA